MFEGIRLTKEQFKYVYKFIDEHNVDEFETELYFNLDKFFNETNTNELNNWFYLHKSKCKIRCQNDIYYLNFEWCHNGSFMSTVVKILSTVLKDEEIGLYKTHSHFDLYDDEEYCHSSLLCVFKNGTKLFDFSGYLDKEEMKVVNNINPTSITYDSFKCMLSSEETEFIKSNKIKASDRHILRKYSATIKKDEKGFYIISEDMNETLKRTLEKYNYNISIFRNNNEPTLKEILSKLKTAILTKEQIKVAELWLDVNGCAIDYEGNYIIDKFEQPLLVQAYLLFARKFKTPVNIAKTIYRL